VRPELAFRTLVSLRFVIGASAWLTPRLAGKGFGLDTDGNPQAPYLGRLFGARDVALGAGALQSSGAARTQWLQIGLAVDTADAIAAVAGGRAGYLSPVTAGLLFAPAAAAVALGAMALQGDAAPE
jgi:hypothetical protein